MKALVAISLLAFVVGAEGAEKQKLVASATFSVQDTTEHCKPESTPGYKVIKVGEDCVKVKQERKGQRSCQFVFSARTTLDQQDDLMTLCLNTALEPYSYQK